jgi:hypothetical protein
MLEAMARISPSQPNEAIARIVYRRNGTILLDPSFRVKILENWARLFQNRSSSRPPVSQSPEPRILRTA